MQSLRARNQIVAEVISKNDDSDLPSVVNSGDSQVKAWRVKRGNLRHTPPKDMGS